MRVSQIDFVNPRHGEGFSKYGAYCQPYGGEVIRQVVRKKDPAIRVRIVDETRGDKIDFEGDVMFGTAYTYPVKRLYEIARAYRKRGKPAVLGGIHVSAVSNYPELSSLEFPNANSVVIGEGESVLGEVVNDIKSDRLKPVYRGQPVGSDFPVLCEEPMRWGWTYPIQFLRGCPWWCEFCSVPVMFGGKYRPRPIPSILKEIEHYHNVRKRANTLFAVDDDINDPREIYPVLENVHRAFGYVRGGWTSATDMNLVVNFKGEVNHKFLSLANKTNCISLYFGFENVNPGVLRNELGVKKNTPGLYWKVVKACHEYGIAAWGSTILSQLSTGWKDVEFMVDWFNSVEVDVMGWTILTPLPGTALFNKIYREGVVYPKNERDKARKVAWLDMDWAKYDVCHTVWLPEGSTHSASDYEDMRDWAQRHYEKQLAKSFALITLHLLRRNRETRRHIIRAFVGAKHRGVLPEKFIERVFFGNRARQQLTY